MTLSKQYRNTDLKVKRAIVIVVSLLLIMILAIASALISRQIDIQTDRSVVFGTWDEQNVPDYARDSFTVREEGIYINERVVDVDYSFDGSTLMYEYQEQKYIYVIRDEHNTVLQRVAPLHYESTFHLRGKYQPKPEPATDE